MNKNIICYICHNCDNFIWNINKIINDVNDFYDFIVLTDNENNYHKYKNIYNINYIYPYELYKKYNYYKFDTNNCWNGWANTPLLFIDFFSEHNYYDNYIYIEDDCFYSGNILNFINELLLKKYDYITPILWQPDYRWEHFTSIYNINDENIRTASLNFNIYSNKCLKYLYDCYLNKPIYNEIYCEEFIGTIIYNSNFKILDLRANDYNCYILFKFNDLINSFKHFNKNSIIHCVKNEDQYEIIKKLIM